MTKKDIMEFAGIWKNLSNKEIEDMKKEIMKLRKRGTKAMLRKVKRN
ncbi:hypothetical protein K8R33_03100 [archaeon]|nr:hypothetical protein [archaeon]